MQAPKGDSALEGSEAETTDSAVVSTATAKRNSSSSHVSDGDTSGEHIRRPARADEPFEKWEREEMEELLHELRGHLGNNFAYIFCFVLSCPKVLYPTRFLEGEDVSNNFLFNADRSVIL